MQDIINARILRDDKGSVTVVTDQVLPAKSLTHIRQAENGYVMLTGPEEDYRLFGDIPSGSSVVVMAPPSGEQRHKESSFPLKWA